MKKLAIYFILLLFLFSLVGCSSNGQGSTKSLEEKTWKEIVETARGTTVNFYGWGGDQRVNQWIDEILAPSLKEKYNVKVNRVGMNIDDILNKLLGEKQVDKKNGSIDVVWINGENFYTAKKNGLLYGPFTKKLANFNKYIDKDSHDANYDFGFLIDGYEAPYGKAQLVFIYDSAKLSNVPRNYQELLKLAKENPGKITYPAPPDFTGSAFIRNMICDIVGFENIKDIEPDKEKVKEAIAPAIEYLKELKPYLWMKGEAYPATVAQLNNLFADGEILLGMSYTPYLAAGKIQTGDFPETTDTFVFENGNIGNTHFLAIPFNSPNKEGAMVFINHVLSVEMQASKYDPNNWGDLPVLDSSKLNEEEKKVFENIKLGKGALPQETLLSHRIPELPADVIPIIEEIWMENIPKKGE